MPFIAFDLDALEKSPQVARAAAMQPESISHGLLLMWVYCWKEKVERVTTMHVRGFFGGGDVTEALVAFGFLEQTEAPESFRVKGADRYLRVRQSRVDGGKKSKGSLVPGASHRKHADHANARETHEISDVSRTSSSAGAHEVEESSSALTSSIDHLKEEDIYTGGGGVIRGPSAADIVVVEPVEPAPPHDDKRPSPVSVIAPTEPTRTWAGADFWRWAQSVRQKAGLLAEKPPHLAKLSTWWASARMQCTTEVLQEAFFRFGDDKFWQRKDPPCPFAGFMSQWAKYIRQNEVQHASA